MDRVQAVLDEWADRCKSGWMPVLEQAKADHKGVAILGILYVEDGPMQLQGILGAQEGPDALTQYGELLSLALEYVMFNQGATPADSYLQELE